MRRRINSLNGEQAGENVHLRDRGGKAYRSETAGAQLGMAAQQKVGGEPLNWRVKVAEYQQTNQQSHHRVTIPAQPTEITLSAIFAHEQHDTGTAIERRDRQQVKGAEKQVQEEEDQQGSGQKIGATGCWIEPEVTSGASNAQACSGQEHERIVCGGTCEG